MRFARVLAFGAICSSTVVAAPASGFSSNNVEDMRLIQTSEDTEPFWVTEDQKLELLRSRKGFFDLTESYFEVGEKRPQEVMAIAGHTNHVYPHPSKSSVVKSIISTLSIPRMEATLGNLTAFNNRYYKSESGVAASDWIYGQLASISSGKNGISISQFEHPWPQKSIIARFDGAVNGASAVILGSHIDSINLKSPMKGRAPGVDDNGTGTSNLIEVFRALVAVDFSPARPVEFHFYSGEEVGLLGSRAIATKYKNDGIPVYAMVNFDMTGYFQPGSKEVIALASDRVDPTLNDYLRSLISAYCSIPAGTDYCGYACSDHASWHKYGYPSAFPFEAPTEHENPYTHTPKDTTSIEGFSWSHSLEFAKLAVAVAVELGSVTQ